MNAQACCMCVPIGHAVKILGFIDIVLWVQAAHNADIIRFSLLMATSTLFALLMQRDTSIRRRNYFVAFTVYRVILALMFAYRIYKEAYIEQTLDFQLAVQNVC